MSPIRIKLLAHQNAPEKIFEQGKKKIEAILENHIITYENSDSAILYFLTGGSEQYAIENLDPSRFYILLATPEENSYAAASEIKAFLQQNNIKGQIINLTLDEDLKILKEMIQLKGSLERLQGKKIAVIGEPSKWLVASTIENKLLKAKLGLKLSTTSWKDMGDFMEVDEDKDFQKSFASIENKQIRNDSRIFRLLKEKIDQDNLSGIAVECFSLVQDSKTTGCLSLARLNNLGIPTACEGDITSLTGLILLQAVTGIIPWMANLAQLDGQIALFAHCTAPTNLLSSYKIKTHFETDLGNAIEGELELPKSNDLTIVRLSSDLEQAFITNAKLHARPTHSYACRTQIEVKLSENASTLLKESPLGNHHLIIPGDHTKAISLAMKLLGMNII